jgi:hypothetical protein
MTPRYNSQEHNPVQSLSRLFNLNKTQKRKQWIVIYHWQWGRGGVLNQHQRTELGQSAELSARKGGARNKNWELGWVNKPASQIMGMVHHWASPMVLRVILRTELPHLVGGGAGQAELQLLPGKNNNTVDHLAQTGSELPEVPMATCPVDKRNQILFTSQPSG